jgi:hypothetical protein
MVIDCDTCAVRGPACGDCVVTVLLGSRPDRLPGPGAELDPAEQAAIAVLATSGLVPPLRLVPVDEPTPACEMGLTDDSSPTRGNSRRVAG